MGKCGLKNNTMNSNSGVKKVMKITEGNIQLRINRVMKVTKETGTQW